MSASNYAVCPRCHQQAVRQSGELREQVQLQYGKIPIAEWDALRSAAEAEIDESSLRTFREDWEIGVSDVDGEFYVTYSGACSTCGFSHRFETKQTLDLPDDGRHYDRACWIQFFSADGRLLRRDLHPLATAQAFALKTVQELAVGNGAFGPTMGVTFAITETTVKGGETS